MRLQIFQPETKIVGLQFGDTSLRAVELGASTNNAYPVVAASEIAIPKTAIQNDTIADPSQLAKSIIQMYEHPLFGTFNSRSVTVNLPETKCFVRVIHMQHMSDSEVDSAIPFEAESYIPIPIDQVYLDWEKLSEADGKMELLIIASPKEYVDKVVMTLEEAHLIPAALEVESQSLCRLLLDPATTKDCLIANIQSARTDLIIIERGGIQFTSTVPLGGAIVTEAIAKALGLSNQAANEIKEKYGIANTTEYPNLKTVLDPVLNNFVAEIKNILNFQLQHSQTKIGTIYLTGGGAQLQHFDEFLNEEFRAMGVTVQVPNPLDHCMLPKDIQNFPKFAFSTALGLAMRKIV